jgi:threonyl-tRNA synthetase
MMIITLADGSKREYNSGISALEVAENISKSLSKKAVIAEINDKQLDLSTKIYESCNLKIITNDDESCLETIRHDTAHVLAMAAKELYGDKIQVTIGPAIENGFYYDFATGIHFSTDDLEIIEKKMHEIVARNDKFIRESWARNDAIKYFLSIGEKYKAEIIESIAEDQEITLYRQGNFLDLCRGPHAPSTGYLKHFKLLKVSGAYWRGDSKNEMLQRIYGTAWESKEALEKHLFMLEESEKRYHVKIGKELDLFHMQQEAVGMVFWHDKGWTLWRIIEDYIRNKLKEHNYIEVKTPTLVDKKLWEMSGHWDKFRQNMFTSETHDGELLALKPMNCPCHVQIFNQGIKSYKDLPIRMAEFGSCHRYEPSGALHGLMRVRGFVQDDAHIFCTEDQINEETIKFCEMLKSVYKDFGFTDIKVKFSDRPENRAGSDEVWDKAENALRDAAIAAGLDFSINTGEGAFYGPKLEFVLVDALGRDWQCGTIQADFVLPERLGALYVNDKGEKVHPVMLHRVIIGSFERFIGILIEHYAGKFPLWLSPVQIAIATVTNDFDEYAKSVCDKLISIDKTLRIVLDSSSEKIGYKIRNHSVKKIPIIVVIGKNEMDSGNLSVRFLGSNDLQEFTIDELISFVHNH